MSALAKACELNLRWVTEPPLKVLTWKQLITDLRTLSRNMAGWTKVTVPDAITEENIDKRDWHDPQRSQQKVWNKRIGQTRSMFKPKQFNNDYIIGYYVQDQPIGFLAMMDMMTAMPYISAIVTHPGSENAGGILIEAAVQKSDEWQQGGNLELTAGNDNAAKAYECLGFEKKPDKPAEMTLDPSKMSQYWSRVGSKWRLTKYIGKLYVA